LDISNIFSKIESKADVIGNLYGYLAPMATSGGLDALGNIVFIHDLALQNVMKGKIPTFDGLKTMFERHTKQPITMGVGAYIVGELFGDFLGKHGNALKRAGEGMIKGGALATVVMSFVANSPLPEFTRGGSGSGGNPFDRSLN